MCNFISLIFRIHSNTFKNMIHPDTLIDYLTYDDNIKFYNNCNKMRNYELEKNLMCPPINISNNDPSFYGIFYLSCYITDYLYYCKKFNN